MREIPGRCRVTRADMSNVAMCHFIQLIPRMTSSPWPFSTMRPVSNTRPARSRGALWTSRSASNQPLGVLIMYGVFEATRDNVASLAQMELIKSCDAPESNSITIGRLLRKNVPVSTSSPMAISSTVV
jgi:hypothetical protein